MATPSGLVDKQELIDAQLDTAHLGRVVNSKDAGGNPITTSTNRTGGVNKTLDALEREYQEAIRSAGGVPIGDGTWQSGQTFTAYNQFMVYNGVPYKPLSSTTLPYGPTGATPDLAFVGPFSEVSATDITAAQGELINGSIFPTSGDLEVGNVIPPNTTHLRIDGVIYTMGQIVDGVVNAINASSVTIGIAIIPIAEYDNTDVNSEDYAHLAIGGLWSDAVNAALIEASIKGVNCLLPRQILDPKYDKTVVVPKGVKLIGKGIGKWVAGFADIELAPSTMLFVGVGAKSYELDNIGALSSSGGHIPNPDAAEAYNANANNDFYEFTDLTNGDAVGVTKATLKQLSVAVELKDNAQLIGVRVVPDYNGVSGYVDQDLTGLGANWDIGVLENQSRGSGGQYVQVAGYWRVAGLLKAYQTKDDPNDFTNAEDSNWYKSMFQGYRGFLGRGNDTYKVISVTSTSITIPWDKSHRFDNTGSVRVGGADYAYSALSYAANELTFTVSDSTGVSVGNLLRKTGSNFGSSGSQFIDCELHDLMHSSRLMANSTEMDDPFNSSSACYEISGEPSRAIQFTCCTVIGRDDIIALSGNNRDVIHVGTYFESAKGRLLKTDGIFSGTLANGGRYIALNGDGLVTANLRFIAHTDSFLDFTSPAQGSVAPPRFTVGGLFNPREFFNDKYDLRTVSGELRIGSEARQTRLYAEDNVLVQDSTGNGTIKSGAGSLQLFSGLRARIGKSTADCILIDSDKLTPSDDGLKALGQPTFTFKEIYLKDDVTGTNYRVRIESGSLVLTAL